MYIGPVQPTSTPALNLASTNKVDKRPGFADHMKSSFDTTNKLQHNAQTAMEELATGRNGNIHETLISMSKAETSFKMLMQVRNKVLNAYQEVMRMQV